MEVRKGKKRKEGGERRNRNIKECTRKHRDTKTQRKMQRQRQTQSKWGIHGGSHVGSQETNTEEKTSHADAGPERHGENLHTHAQCTNPTPRRQQLSTKFLDTGRSKCC